MERDIKEIRSILSRDDEDVHVDKLEKYVEKVRKEAVMWAANKYAGARRDDVLNEVDIVKLYDERNDNKTPESLSALEYMEEINGMTAEELMNHMTDSSKGPKYDGDEIYSEEEMSLFEIQSKRNPPVVISPDGEFVNNLDVVTGRPADFSHRGGIVNNDTREDCRRVQNDISKVRHGVEVDAGSVEAAEALILMAMRGYQYSTTGDGKTTDWDFVRDGTVVKRVERKNA